MPLATGENLYGAAAFTPYLEAVEILQPDLGKAGGVTEYLAVLSAAEAAGRTVNPHLYNSASRGSRSHSPAIAPPSWPS
ncbi:hypothetical protein JNW88_15890 [Micromonospora sp. ATA32]|nr:hypothetical protein [Micromonospora sp. ATA32]